MTLEELKKYKYGICLGYSSIGYLMNNVYPYNSEPDEDGYVPLGIYKNCLESKLYPIIIYYKNTDGKEGILCRPMIYEDNLLKPIGLLYSDIDSDKIPYFARVVYLPIETDIDSIYEYKREPIILNR